MYLRTMDVDKSEDPIGDARLLLERAMKDAVKTENWELQQLLSAADTILSSAEKQILDVSDETVASWLEAGVLETAHTPTSDLPRVEPASLLGVKEQLDDLRGQGLSRSALASLLRGSPRIGGPEDRPWAKQRTDITDRELAELRAGKIRR